MIGKENVTRKVADLIPYANNARTHSDEQVAQVASSIRQWGWTMPVLIDPDNTIIAGHCRVRAARILDIDEVPCIIAEGWSDPQKRAYVLADNKLSMNAGWDPEMLKLELDGLTDLDFELPLIGFDLDELAEIFNDPTEGITDPDATPEMRPDVITQDGDIWLLGAHRLYCGSCMDQTSYDKLIIDGAPDLIVTSPPYNQNLQSFRLSGMQKEAPSFVNRLKNAYSDSMPEEDYRSEQMDLLSILMHNSGPKASLFYNHKNRYRDKVIVSPYEWLKQSDWSIRQEIIWDRAGSITLNARMFMPCDERIYWMTKGDFYFSNTTEAKSLSTVWRIAPRNDIKGASAPFPTELPLRCIEHCSKTGSIVLDPYSGTGTTMIAAERIGRTFVGIEINPYYCDISVRRWQEFTGIEATRESDGIPFNEIEPAPTEDPNDRQDDDGEDLV